MRDFLKDSTNNYPTKGLSKSPHTNPHDTDPTKIKI